MSNGKKEPPKPIRPVFGRNGGTDVLDFQSHQERKFDIKGTQVTLVHQNLFETSTQGFVIPQWKDKASDGGIAFAGMQVFGDDFNQAYADFVELNTTREDIARVVMYPDQETGHFFFHTVTVQTGHLHAARNVSDAVTFVLSQCEENGLESIGFPAMCTGIQGELLDEQSAKTMANAIYKFSLSKPSDVKIVIAISGYDSRNRFNAFLEVLENPASYQDFDPSAEVGQRPEDIRRTIHDRALHGKLPMVVIGVDGKQITPSRAGAQVHRLPKPEN